MILNASKPSSIGLAEEASARFGKDRILLSINNVDFILRIRIRLKIHSMKHWC